MERREILVTRARRLRRRWRVSFRLGEQFLDEQHRAPQELRLVDRIARHTRRAHQEPRAEQPIAVALRGLDRGFQESTVLGRELQRLADQLLRLLVPP